MKRLAASVGVAVVMFTATPARSATIALEPSSLNVELGSLFVVQVVVSGLQDGAAPSLSAFDLDLTFDADLLAFESAAFGDPLLGDQLGLSAGSLTSATPALGQVNLFGLSFAMPDELHTLQAGQFVLAALEFRATGPGTSPLMFTSVIFGDALGDELLASSIAGASVVVDGAAVPEPASIWLMLSGVGLIAGRLRARRRILSAPQLSSSES